MKRSESLVFTGTNTAAVSSTVAIIAHISRPEDAVKQPVRHPVWTVLAVGRASVKQLSLNGSNVGVLPCVDNSTMLTLFGDVVPEERGLTAWIIAFVFDKAAPIALQPIVHFDGLILVPCQSQASFVDLI